MDPRPTFQHLIHASLGNVSYKTILCSNFFMLDRLQNIKKMTLFFAAHKTVVFMLETDETTSRLDEMTMDVCRNGPTFTYRWQEAKRGSNKGVSSHTLQYGQGRAGCDELRSSRHRRSTPGSCRTRGPLSPAGREVQRRDRSPARYVASNGGESDRVGVSQAGRCLASRDRRTLLLIPLGLLQVTACWFVTSSYTSPS